MRALSLRAGSRLVAAGSSILLVTSGLMLTSLFSAAPASASAGQVAPYVDMSNSQEGVLNTVISSDGLRSFTAAFAIGSGCSDIWGDTLPIGNDPTIGGEISSAKAAGASVIVSSGGAAGEPISFTCTTQSTIDAAYQAIINDYATNQLDFDIEGAAIADTAGIDRTFQAMKDLKASNPSLAWSVTVPVLPSGLVSTGTALLQDAQNMGVTIPIVNVMAMDYGQGTGTEMGNAAISAAQNTLNQMRAVNGSYSYANVGITPMIGVNDDGSTFTLADASSVASWASSNGIGRLAFWSVDRDQACPGGNGGAASPTCSGVSESTGQFTGVFTGAGGGTPPPPPPPPPPTEGPFGGTAAAIPGTVQAANYDTGGQGVAYNVTSVKGTANSYRSDGVDLEACTDTGCGDDIGWTAAGQWFKYTVNVATAGTYTVSLRLASVSGATDGLHIASSSGANLSGNINVPATGAWQTWTTVTATVTLAAGQQTLTIDQDNAGWNIHQLTFASPSGSEGPFGGTAAAIPGTVQAANYDTGGQGVAYNVTSVNGTANSYRSDGVDLEACTDTGCGDDIGWTAAGQWFKYTVNVATAGTYTVSLRLASVSGATDGLHIASSSDANLSGNINVPATGAWQTWTTVTATVTLPAGVQTLTVNQDNGGWNVYTMAFASSSSGGGGGGAAPWAVGVAYTVGELVTYQGHTYKCLQAHTSEAGWDPVDAPALWQLVS